MITAKIIADSKNQFGNRITTFVLTFPRFILAELNTHRMFSRNSASSRAIPFATMVRNVQDNPFIPMAWMKDHKGMQGGEYFDKCDTATLATEWLRARDAAVESAIILNKLGLTKQICNRLLEPFMYHTAIVTATDWGNFFALRAHEAAEIHFQELANRMLEAYNNSEPVLLQPGEWHIPFGDTSDLDRLYELLGDADYVANHRGQTNYFLLPDVKVMIATARCARVSYLNFEGKDDYIADVKLHDGLLAAGHMSPFEHCAKNDMQTPQYSGNFFGFTQYRKMLVEENRADNRITNKI